MNQFQMWLLDVLIHMEKHSIKGIISFKSLERLCENMAYSMNPHTAHREGDAQVSKQEMNKMLEFLLRVSLQSLEEIQRKCISLIKKLHIQINDARGRAERYLLDFSSLEPLSLNHLKRYTDLSKKIYLKLDLAVNECDSPCFALNAVSIYREEFQRMRDCLGIMPLRKHTSSVYQDIKKIKNSLFNDSRIKLYRLSTQFSLFLVLYTYCSSRLRLRSSDAYEHKFTLANYLWKIGFL